MKAATIQSYAYSVKNKISIHAAREGGDDATMSYDTAPGISIHAAREGGDPVRTRIGFRQYNFNPRRP